MSHEHDNESDDVLILQWIERFLRYYYRAIYYVGVLDIDEDHVQHLFLMWEMVPRQLRNIFNHPRNLNHIGGRQHASHGIAQKVQPPNSLIAWITQVN